MKKLTDIERVERWKEICIKHGFSGDTEIDFWLDEADVDFSGGGSATPLDSYALSISSLEKVLPNVDDEQLATFILEAITGVLIFNSLKTERYFWNKTEELLAHNDILIPPEIKPSYVRGDYDNQTEAQSLP
jgi:hypothetical protein